MKQYLDYLQHILENGVIKRDRTGTGTKSIFGYQMRFDLSKGFPAVTTKKIHFKSIIHELIWFLNGATNIKYLKENGVTIWDAWADEKGDLGPVYGSQWRSWTVLEENLDYDYEENPETTLNKRTIDQISEVIEQIKSNPDSRRHIVSAWNVGEIDQMALPPCHLLFQFYVAEGKLSCQLYQRSADSFLGIPFNIASYALLTHMIAQVCNLEVGEFIHTIGDGHIYLNHIDQVKLQLSREPIELPKLYLNSNIKNIFDFKFSDIIIDGYKSHPGIKGEISV